MHSIVSFFKQGIAISKAAWQRNLNYRFTILAYRIGEISEVLVLILMWSAIYSSGTTTVKGFTQTEMITYILMGNLFSVAVRNFLPGFVSRDINEGRLSMFLVRPISYLKYIFFHEMGRSLLAILVSIASQLIVVVFFLNKIYSNTDWRYLILLILMITLAFILELMIGFLIGTIAFWTDEVDGIDSTLSRVKKFFSGGYFPLNLLPASLSAISLYLPFAYSFYMPALLYLKKISFAEGLHGILVEVVWIIILSIIINIVWRRGLKRYEAVGM